MSLQKLKNFLQYNNAAILILVVFFLVGGSVLAAPAGKEALGSKQTRVEGVDNTLLLLTDLDAFEMKFKIETVKEDEEYYYVTYTYNNLVIKDNVWQQEVRELTRKVTKKLDKDLGQYIATQLKDEHDARIAELKAEKAKAETIGEAKRVQVTEYSGLIGKVLDVTKEVFPGYEPVEKVELPSPEFKGVTINGGSDNLTEVYNQYVQTHINELPTLANQNISTTTATSTPEVITAVPETPASTTPEVPVTTNTPENNEQNVIIVPVTSAETIADTSTQ